MNKNLRGITYISEISIPCQIFNCDKIRSCLKLECFVFTCRNCSGFDLFERILCRVVPSKTFNFDKFRLQMKQNLHHQKNFHDDL